MPPPHSSSQTGVWKSTLGFWKERPFGNIGNSTGRCRYVLSGRRLWCLKGTTPPKALAKNNRGASGSQRHTVGPVLQLAGQGRIPFPRASVGPSTSCSASLCEIGEDHLHLTAPPHARQDSPIQHEKMKDCPRKVIYLQGTFPVAFHLQRIGK